MGMCLLSLMHPLYPSFLPPPLSLSLSPASSVALWTTTKKKPQVIKSHSPESAGEMWVTAVTALPHSDLVASGACQSLL